MTVYLAIIAWDYEGSETLGVYTTERKAKNRIERERKTGRYWDEEYTRSVEVDK